MALLLQLTQRLAHGFSAFWVRWPRKVAKLDAEKAWNKVVTADDEPLIQAALDWQVPIFEAREPEHRPHAQTWINGRRWEDEPPTPKKPTINLATVKGMNVTALKQIDATRRIADLIQQGMNRDEAVRTVSLEMGWIQE